MAERRLDLILGARDASGPAFASLKAQLEGTRTAAAAAGGAGGLGSLVSVATRILPIAAAIKATHTGLVLVQGASKALRGDFDGMLDSLSRLPLGLGRVVKEFRAAYEEISLKTWAKEQREILDAEIEAYTKKVSASHDFAKKIANDLLAQQRAIELARLDDEDKAFRQSQWKREDTLERIADLRAELERRDMSGGSRARAMKDLERLEQGAHALFWAEAQAEADARAEKYRQADEKLENERRKEAEKRQLEANKEYEERVRAWTEAARQASEAVEKVEGELRIKRLQSMKQYLEAEREAIRQHYAKRIADAKSELEREGLRKLMGLDLAAVGAAGGLVGRRLAPSISLGANYSGRDIDFQAGTLDISQKQLQALERIERLLGDANRRGLHVEVAA